MSITRPHRRDRRRQTATSTYPLGATLAFVDSITTVDATNLDITISQVSVNAGTVSFLNFDPPTNYEWDPSGVYGRDVNFTYWVPCSSITAIAPFVLRFEFFGSTGTDVLVIEQWLKGLRLPTGQWLSGGIWRGIGP